MAKLIIAAERLRADAKRVVVRPFDTNNETRSRRIVDAVMSMSARTVTSELALVAQDFGNRHRRLLEVFQTRYDALALQLDLDDSVSELRQLLIGAFFSSEYSFAAAALMNPSVVAHPDQTGLPDGAVRFVMSLRAVGEGHISSICFREGIVTAPAGIELLPQPNFAIAAAGELDGDECAVTADTGNGISGTVLFPMTPAQRGGLEDLRLLRFLDDDSGTAQYLGTYTAYNGVSIRSELLATDDFKTFTLRPFEGPIVKSKGMALFPRKVGGKYAMIGRQDHESLFLLYSDDLMHWEQSRQLIGPSHAWELLQIGNCGAPIEIDEGWLLLTHGVGAMRKYSIGAVLLDKDDPSKVLGRTRAPLLSPLDEDREGYVPNVVYSCGGMAVGRTLFLPFGVADSSVAFGFVEIDDLLTRMSLGGMNV